MTVFVASDGATLEVDDNGWVYTSAGRITPDDMTTLREFFQHHTYPDRKPWEDANPGDVWEIEYANVVKEAAMVNKDGDFLLNNGVVVTAKWVSNAINVRRIYPESDHV